MTDRIHQMRAYGLTHPDPRVRRFMQAHIEREQRRQNPPPLPEITPPAPPKMFTGPALSTGHGRPHRWDEIADEMVDDESREAREA